MADSGLDPGEGPSGLVAQLPLVNSPMSPPNNVSLSTPGLPPPPSQSPGLLKAHNSTQIARLQTNYDEQVMSPPIAPIPRSPAPRSPAPSVSDSDCEIVAVVKKENTSGQPQNQNTAAHQRGVKRSQDIRKLNVCEILQARDDVDAKKQRLLNEYFDLDRQSTELTQALREKLGYRL